MKYFVILLNGFKILDSMISHFLAKNDLTTQAIPLPLQEGEKNIQDKEIV